MPRLPLLRCVLSLRVNTGFLLYLAVAGGICHAQVSTPPSPMAMHAKWITAPGLSERAPVVLHFQRVLDLDAVPEHLPVHVSADNAYLLHVNGQLASRGPARSDLQHWHYETVDLAPLLHAGKNVLASTVWEFGDLRAVAQNSNLPAFFLQSDTTPTVDTGNAWKVEVESAYAVTPMTRAIMPGYYAAEPIIRL